MANEHWFDALNKMLARDAPRRAVMGSALALLAGLFADGVPVTEAGKKKKRRKRKQKQKRKLRRSSCSNGACASSFSSKRDRDYCEFICRQCDGSDPREFCIVEGDPFDPANVAVCCVEGATCCGDRCCGDPNGNEDVKCCGDRCANTRTDRDNCGRCGNRCHDLTCVESRCCITGMEPNHWCNPQIKPNFGCCSGVCLENGRCQPI